ncbi:MAG: sarcosine oxidase subunit alpha family protein [Aestuariivita sp.]|nr:sarcosine oxidase subunit alpha family protein [Aestuariivita sp.]
MRVEGKGLIDRHASIQFKFDAVRYSGFKGDTLASALLANDIRLIARSFKYHRPRGVLTAGSEEPNALVTIKSDQGFIPNTRATVQEIYTDLEARSQNCWPTLAWDVRSLFDLAAPFIGAGFYYKTFMWPGKFWELLYEPFIRKSAGLGMLSKEVMAERFDKAWAYCDLLIIGGGPSGLIAALTAGRAGIDVIVADEDSRMGGRLLAETDEVNGYPGHVWVDQVLAELEQLPNVRLMRRTTVTGVYDNHTFSALERSSCCYLQSQDVVHEIFWRIVAKHSILAAGAIERPIAFQNNDRPGVMMASSVRAYLNRWGVSPGRSFAIFANNDNARRTVRDLKKSGIHIEALIDCRSDVESIDGIRLIKSATVDNVRGIKSVKGISVRTESGHENISVDTVALSGGWNPTINLACHLHKSPVWQDEFMAFVPAANAVPGLLAIGSCRGLMSTADCFKDGIDAGLHIAKELGKTATSPEIPNAEDDRNRLQALWYISGKGRAWLDFQNDVTVKDIQQAVTENYHSVEHLKRYTTQGMAIDQGKLSNVTTLAILAELTGRTIPETGTTTFRPPYTPVSLGAIGAGVQGKSFAPERLLTSHSILLAREAPMIESDLWYRPRYFPNQGEVNWQQSCIREVGYVRQTVGVSDVSTLGKIDIQGVDAAKLLDFVYINMFSNLRVGRVRYGLMLREDGHAMDDGTTARLGEFHFVMTTTTAAAAQVLAHLEFVHQCLYPEWDLAMTSVTEQWAQFAIAGPKAQELVNDILDDPIDNSSWPFMACGDITFSGVKARLFRISFSGEHGYEIAVPSRYGESLFQILISKAENLGGGPYGMEALNVLRIEKGFITHSEIDGRKTAYDLGMARMISNQKDFIGKKMALRPGLQQPVRERLVGLRPKDPSESLTAGAHLFSKDAETVRENDQGYISSVGYSATFGQTLALGFLQNGFERHGEVVQAVDHLRRLKVYCQVTNPVFFDPEGARARG